jgi:hypothetical protein
MRVCKVTNWIEASLRDAVLALTQNGETDIASSLGRLLEEPEVRELHLFRSLAVAALADEVCDCECLDALYSIFDRICSAFSVAHCTIHRIRERSIAPSGTKVLTNYPGTWIAEYINRRYFSIDPVVARALEGPGVFFWDEIERADPITTHFTRSATEHGVGPSGITFVADNLHGDTIAISLAVPLAHASFRNLFTPKLSDFTDLAALLLDVFSDLTCSFSSERVVLTDDQLKVLKAVVAGRSRTEIEMLPCAYGSFATVEKSILKNLNATTLPQAVAIAVKQRLLEILPFFEDDIYPECRRPFAA